MHGYHGRYLHIDATTRRAELVELDAETLRAFLGGVGLGAWIAAGESRPGADPLGLDAAIVFALSPLVGSPLTTSAKFAVVAVSPLTGRLSDALSSSHFAIAAKRAGVDAIAVRGVCEDVSVVLVDGLGREGPQVTFESAEDVWGLPARDAERKLRDRLGPEWQIAAIGPAGERRIPFATISHDGRHAGRGGLGAVMGAKRIKAIAVRGDRRTTVADPMRTVALAKTLSARSFGPATEKYRELGTVANLLVFNRFDSLPTRNFAAGHFEGAEALAAANLAPAREVARKSCAACTIGCEHVYATKSGGGVRMEYESLYALGPLCGVSDPGDVMAAAERCDALGLDTISTGGTIAFLMDCAEQGLLSGADARLPSGQSLRFGNGRAVVEAIDAAAEREGVGRLVAMGSRAAAAAIGGAAIERAVHVKGMELPGYDPRALHTMALGLAVGTRGADHNRSGAYEADFSGRVDRLQGGAESALAAIETEDKAALMDSLILCKFLRAVFSDLYGEAAEMLGAVTGWDFNAEELRRVAERVVSARKLINEREGWTRAEDTLPARLLEPGDGSGLTEARLRRMIDAYYEGRGWDGEGRVGLDVRTRLGLRDGRFGSI